MLPPQLVPHDKAYVRYITCILAAVATICVQANSIRFDQAPLAPAKRPTTPPALPLKVPPVSNFIFSPYHRPIPHHPHGTVNDETECSPIGTYAIRFTLFA